MYRICFEHLVISQKYEIRCNTPSSSQGGNQIISLSLVPIMVVVITFSVHNLKCSVKLNFNDFKLKSS